MGRMIGVQYDAFKNLFSFVLGMCGPMIARRSELIGIKLY